MPVDCGIRRCSGPATGSCRRRRVRTSRPSIASSMTTSRTAAGRTRSPTRRASRCSRRPPARTTNTTTGPALPWDCSPCTTAGLQDDAGVLRRRPVARAGRPPAPKARRSARPAACVAGGRVWPKDHAERRQVALPEVPVRAGRRGAARRRVSGSGSSATCPAGPAIRSGPAPPSRSTIYGGAPRDGRTSARVVRADQALALPLAREVSAACDGPGRSYARHGFSFTLPRTGRQRLRVRARREQRRRPAAPPTLIRNGIVHVPRCAHSEHVAGVALTASCSACATSVCNDGRRGLLHRATWTDECAAAADACAAANSSAPANSPSSPRSPRASSKRPSTGTTRSTRRSSRAGCTSTARGCWTGSRPRPAPPADDHPRRRSEVSPALGSLSGRAALGRRGPGLTWQPPGTVGQAPDPAGQLYALAPGGAGPG